MRTIAPAHASWSAALAVRDGGPAQRPGAAWRANHRAEPASYRVGDLTD